MNIMKNLSIEELRKIQIEILNFFDSFCRDNNLRYFLSNGTLLGAVKYKGFIPWDDDIDVCMPRADYEHFLNLFAMKSKQGDYYKLYSLNNEKQYYFPFAKLVDDRTILIEQNVDNGVILGVNIDIFPLDAFGNTQEEVTKLYNKMQKLRHDLNFSKLINYTGGKIKRLAKRIVAFRYKIVAGNGAAHYSKKINRLAQKKNNEDCLLEGNVVWGFYPNGEAHEKSVFKEAIEVYFEGRKYFAPIGYDVFLRRLYGDYWQDPPKEKQVTHHSYIAYFKNT